MPCRRQHSYLLASKTRSPLSRPLNCALLARKTRRKGSARAARAARAAEGPERGSASRDEFFCGRGLTEEGYLPRGTPLPLPLPLPSASECHTGQLTEGVNSPARRSPAKTPLTSPRSSRPLTLRAKEFGVMCWTHRANNVLVGQAGPVRRVEIMSPARKAKRQTCIECAPR